LNPDIVEAKNLFDEYFNDNKPHEINNKFQEWWSTNVYTWVFLLNEHESFKWIS